MSPFDTGFADPIGVLFVEDFDEEPAPADATPPAPPSYAAQDLDDAREEGRRAGAEEARGEEEAVQSALCNAALAAIGDALNASRTEAIALCEHRAEEIAGAILALLAAALPATAARLAGDEVGAVIDAVLPPLAHMPEVSVRVHPSLLGRVTAHMAAFAGAGAQADASLAPSDVAIVWQDGQARRDWAAVWARLSAALAPFRLPATLAQMMEAEHAG